MITRRKYIEFDCTPVDEDCAQRNSDNYSFNARAEGKQFIELLRKLFGKEPIGAELRVAGPYDNLEVRCYYDEKYPDSVDYAFAIEADLPLTWNETRVRDWKKGAYYDIHQINNYLAQQMRDQVSNWMIADLDNNEEAKEKIMEKFVDIANILLGKRIEIAKDSFRFPREPHNKQD